MRLEKQYMSFCGCVDKFVFQIIVLRTFCLVLTTSVCCLRVRAFFFRVKVRIRFRLG